MIVYCVAGRFVRTQAEAKERAKAQGIKFDPERDAVDVPSKQADLVTFLNEMVADLVGAGAPAATQERHAQRVADSYTERSVAIDETFLALPISHQLTLATLAVEHARRELAIKPADVQLVARVVIADDQTADADDLV